MAAVKSLVRRLFHRDGEVAADAKELNLRLRKAVAHARPRQVAALLDEGAMPEWVPPPSLTRRSRRQRGELNALLLACQYGDVAVLDLLMDALFARPAVLRHFARAMYSLVIRHGHWRAFQLLRQRRVPLDAGDSDHESNQDQHTGLPTDTGEFSGILSSCSQLLNPYAPKLPAPAFVAAEHGRPEMLLALVRSSENPLEWRDYSFKGHSPLAIATRNGHYECVEVLLAHVPYARRELEAAVACAKRHRQAHVLVLLTSCLPEFQPLSGPESLEPKSLEPHVSSDAHRFTVDIAKDARSRYRARGSLAETVTSDDGEEDEASRASLMWLLDERESAESMRRRMDAAGQGHGRDAFGVLRPARRDEREDWHHAFGAAANGFEPPLSTSSAYSDASDDGVAYKPFYDSDRGSEEEEPVERPHRAQVVVATPPTSSTKVINIRSHSCGTRRSRSLPSIDENAPGLVEC